MKRLLMPTLLLALLAGCGGPPSEPTAASPTAPAAPTAAATPGGGFVPATPPAELRMPAPVYALDNGQIARIERDTTTRSLVTRERIDVAGYPPVATFAVGPESRLAFVVGDLAADRLVLTDGRGEGRTVRYEETGHELSDLVWSADGAALYLYLLNNREPRDIPSGLYRLPIAGGPPELLRADDPVDDTANPSPMIFGYYPRAISPDGGRLLIEARSLFYDNCGLGVLDLASGELAMIPAPEGAQIFCGESAWSADGGLVYMLAGATEGPEAGPRLYAAEPGGGPPTALSAPGAYARSPHGIEGGAVRFLLIVPERDGSGTIVGARFVPAELAAPGAAPRELDEGFAEPPGLVRWSPDGSGLVVDIADENGANLLRWLPIGGPGYQLPSTGQRLDGLAWGDT